jgi:hypothetical protein
MRRPAAAIRGDADVSARHFEIIKRPELIVPEAALRRRSICYSGSPPLVLSYLGSDSNFDGSALSFSFGAASPKRYLIAAIAINSATTVTCTIGGVSATCLVTQNENFADSQTGFYIALVASGTSGTVVTSGSSNFAAALYSAVNLQSAAAFATDTDTSQTTPKPLAMSIGVQAKGFILANSFATGNPDATATWTGLTTDTNFRFSHLSFSGQFSAGHITSATAATENMTVNPGGTTGMTCCAVSLR